MIGRGYLSYSHLTIPNLRMSLPGFQHDVSLPFFWEKEILPPLEAAFLLLQWILSAEQHENQLPDDRQT